MPTHFLHMYQKPKIGSAFIKRFQAFNYRHKISANGWFDTASCDVRIDMSEAQQFLDQNIGNRVAIYVDNPVEPIWEGFINRMTFAAGGIQHTISLDEMANRAQVTYTTAPVAPANTTAVNNTDSQAIYGIKSGRLDIGFSGTGTVSNVLGDTILAQRAWPKSSVTQGDGSGLVTLELLGFWHTLDWENFTDTTAALIAVGTFLTGTMLPAVANGTTFFDNADTSQITSSTATVNRQVAQRGNTLKQLVEKFAEVGDGTNYYVAGITPISPNTGTRVLYFRTQNTSILYTARRADGLRIRNPYGQLERPWTVRPDCGIRITDMLPGWSGMGDDPRETWISSIDYDAESQSVTWVGDDNVTAEGAFGLARQVRKHGDPFGAPLRFT